MTSTLDVPEQNQDLVLDQSADDYWNHYQLTFALYSVSDRAIPSAFDGLKPGQRRLLYQMHDSKLLPGNRFGIQQLTLIIRATLHPPIISEIPGQPRPPHRLIQQTPSVLRRKLVD